MIIAACAAAFSCLLVKPDKEYLTYFDFKTLTCLFSVLAVVMALRSIGFFTYASRKLVTVAKSAKSAVLCLVYITFIGSMLIANDMALITFLPLGYEVLTKTGKTKYMAFTFIMQNIAANLGGMLTPFGNPQNLYLYSYFNIPTGQFTAVMLPPFLFAIALITLCCLVFVKNEKLTVSDETSAPLPKKQCAVYLLLFLLSIVIVFRIIHYLIGLAVIFAVLMFMNRTALKRVDYSLLLTFVMFFIFSGNMSRLTSLQNVISPLLEKNALVCSALSCQVISNVPSAILLSKFTDNWQQLLVGVNIGGAGTLIASLASLITYREYVKFDPAGKKKYLITFSLFNFAFLALMTVFCLLIG